MLCYENVLDRIIHQVSLRDFKFSLQRLYVFLGYDIAQSGSYLRNLQKKMLSPFYF